MNYLALICLLVAAATAWAAPKVTQVAASDPNTRIVGGEEVVPHSWPWQVAMLINNASFCGGFIISEEWIVSAAHCENRADLIRVLAGAHNITEFPRENTTQLIQAHEFIVHEGWNRLNVSNDIAVMRLDRPLVFDEYVSAAKLGSVRPAVGTIVTPTGWGKTADGILESVNPVLMQVDVPIISEAECAAEFGNIITENIVCVSGAGGKGVCSGDSGGPLHIKATNEVIGISSFVSNAGCTEGFPEGFTNLVNYRDWITEKTGVEL